MEDEPVDIVAERFDAGTRWDDKVGQDMEAVRTGPDLRFAVVGSPEYLAAAGAPLHPRDLARHRCVGYRLKGSEALYCLNSGRAVGHSRPVRMEGLSSTTRP